MLPRIGGVRLRDLTPAMLRELYADLASRGLAAGRCRTAGITCREHGCDPERHHGLAAKSVRRVHGCLRQALDQAVADELVVRNVAAVKGVAPRRPRDAGMVDPETQAWNTEQARRFLTAVQDDRLAAMWHVFLGCGLRRGEVIALRWEHVELEARTLRVRETVTLAAGKVVAQSDGKTRAARRTLDLDPQFVAVLRAHKARQAAEKLRLASPGATAATSSPHLTARASCRPGCPRRLRGTPALPACPRSGRTACVTRAPRCSCAQGRRSSRCPSGSATRTPPSRCRSTRTRCPRMTAWRRRPSRPCCTAPSEATA